MQDAVFESTCGLINSKDIIKKKGVNFKWNQSVCHLQEESSEHQDFSEEG